MYFLTEEERKQLLKGFLPKSRLLGVAEELRGWNWHQPPLEPVYDLRLGVFEVAGKYCPTGRDLFLRRVGRVPARTNEAMVRGIIFHSILAKILVQAKKLIYDKGVENYQEILAALNGFQVEVPAELEKQLAPEAVDDVRDKARVLVAFEKARIAARLQETLMKQPYIGEDSLVSLTIPVVVEQKLDGSFLGLSPNLSADAFTFSEPMVLDLKFGERRDFHKLTTTGYALVMEAIYEFPVNLGCIIYAEFRGQRLIVKKEMHIIDDELRQWFIEERDEKMRMLYEELDPGVAEECYDECPYFGECH